MLLPAYGFARHEVGPRAADARGDAGLVLVDADLVLGSFLHRPVQFVHPVLSVVGLLAVHQQVHVAGLDVVHAVALIERVGVVNLREVILGVGRGLIVDYHLDALGGGVFHDGVEVIVRVGLSEAEALAILHPVAVPAEVPAFDQHAAEVVRRREIDVALRALGGGTVAFRIQRIVVPCVKELMQNPPDADVFAGLDPRRVFDLAGLVEVEHQARFDQPAGTVGDDHGAPWGDAGVADIDGRSVRPWHQRGLERAFVRGNEVHLREVEQRRFVDGVEAPVSPFDGERGVSAVDVFEQGVVAVGLVIGHAFRKPPCNVVGASEAELGEFIAYRYVSEALREDVTETEAVVEHADLHVQPGRMEYRAVVFVPDEALLTPDCFPLFVHLAAGNVQHFSMCAEHVAAHQFEAQAGARDDGVVVFYDVVAQGSVYCVHGHFQRAVGRDHRVIFRRRAATSRDCKYCRYDECILHTI